MGLLLNTQQGENNNEKSIMHLYISLNHRFLPLFELMQQEGRTNRNRNGTHVNHGRNDRCYRRNADNGLK